MSIIVPLRFKFERYFRFAWEEETSHLARSQRDDREILKCCRSRSTEKAAALLRMHILGSGTPLLRRPAGRQRAAFWAGRRRQGGGPQGAGGRRGHRSCRAGPSISSILGATASRSLATRTFSSARRRTCCAARDPRICRRTAKRPTSWRKRAWHPIELPQRPTGGVPRLVLTRPDWTQGDHVQPSQ